jgi:hypothetical protein
MKKDGWNWDIKVSFLEIYNETIRDLLLPLNKENKDIKERSYDIRHEGGLLLLFLS